VNKVGDTLDSDTRPCGQTRLCASQQTADHVSPRLGQGKGDAQPLVWRRASRPVLSPNARRNIAAIAVCGRRAEGTQWLQGKL